MQKQVRKQRFHALQQFFRRSHKSHQICSIALNQNYARLLLVQSIFVVCLFCFVLLLVFFVCLFIFCEVITLLLLLCNLSLLLYICNYLCFYGLTFCTIILLQFNNITSLYIIQSYLFILCCDAFIYLSIMYNYKVFLSFVVLIIYNLCLLFAVLFVCLHVYHEVRKGSLNLCLFPCI